MKNAVVKRTKNVLNSMKGRIALATAMMNVALANVAYAGSVQETVKTQVTSAMDIVFNLISVGFVVFGLFSLIPGIVAYTKEANGGGDRDEGSKKITFGVVCMILAVMVFAFKTPITNLLSASM